MFLDGLIRAIRAPIDLVRSKIYGVQQIPRGAQADVQNLRSVVGSTKSEIQQGAQAARGAAGKAGQAAKQGQGHRPKKMGWFARKPKCPGCGQKLHPTWDQCPYCGAQVSAAQSAAPMAAASQSSGAPGGKARTMALEMGGGGGGAVQLGWLVPLEGAQGGEIFSIKGRATVGTNADCDIVMRDQSISGRHAEFVSTNNGFRINDLGSTNGTFVNDKRVTSEDLVDGDSVKIGKTNCKFKAMS